VINGTGKRGISRFSRIETPCMQRFSDGAGSARRLARNGAASDVAFRSFGQRRHPETPDFAAPYPCLQVPLSNASPTPSRTPTHGRGHRGALLLRCRTLPFLSRCRLIPALPNDSTESRANPWQKPLRTACSWLGDDGQMCPAAPVVRRRQHGSRRTGRRGSSRRRG
jgi:hypothetical protein